MLAAQNILNPKDGKPVVTPSQDMVLGNYYLTLEREGAIGEGMVFKDANEALLAYQNGYVHLHTRVAVAASAVNNATFTEEQKSMLLLTTVGKLIFNEILPESFPYINEPTNSNLEKETPAKYFVEKVRTLKKLLLVAKKWRHLVRRSLVTSLRKCSNVSKLQKRLACLTV